MNATRRWHRLLVAGHLGLLAWLMAGVLWLNPPAAPRSVVLLILVGPLLLPLRGILHGRPYTVAWSLFLALAYFTHGVVETWAGDPTRWFPAVETALTLLWFTAGIGYVRQSRDHGRQ